LSTVCAENHFDVPCCGSSGQPAVQISELGEAGL
jgi:hypothetical protein